MSIFTDYLKILKFQCYEESKDRINHENQRGTALILLLYSIILIANVIGKVFQHQEIIRDPSISLEVVYMLIADPLFFFVLRKRKINFTAVIYWFEIPLLIISILHGTVWDPHQLTFTFLFFLLILPLLILDKPCRVFSLIILMTLLYLGIDFACKDPTLFGRDLLHACNACLMSIAASLYTLMARIQNIEFVGYFEDKADRDALTGLYNRFGAEQHMKQHQPGLMVYLDLDRFKEVNDEFGHGEGDRVLQETADLLRACFRRDDILTRMGGDEFVVFAPGVWTEEHIQNKMKELLTRIDRIHSSGKYTDVGMTVSIGCAYTTDGSATLEDLLRKADREMYKIKQNGKNGFHIVRLDQSKGGNDNYA